MGRIAWLVVAMMKGNTKDMLDGFCDRLHQQQLLNWGIEERGRYSSYRGLLSVSAPSSHQTSSCVQVSSDGWFFIEQVPASWASGWLLKNIGTERSLFVGNISVMCEQLCAAMARTGWHCT